MPNYPPADPRDITAAAASDIMTSLGIRNLTARQALVQRFIERPLGENDSLEGLSRRELDSLLRGLDQIMIDETNLGSSDIYQTALLHQRECSKNARRAK